jgi:hypothetical protein
MRSEQRAEVVRRMRKARQRARARSKPGDLGRDRLSVLAERTRELSRAMRAAGTQRSVRH